MLSWLQRQEFFGQYFFVIHDGCSWTDPVFLETKDDRIPSDLLQSQEAETVFRNHVQILRLEHRKMEYAYYLFLSSSGRAVSIYSQNLPCLCVFTFM